MLEVCEGPGPQRPLKALPKREEKGDSGILDKGAACSGIGFLQRTQINLKLPEGGPERIWGQTQSQVFVWFGG